MSDPSFTNIMGVLAVAVVSPLIATAIPKLRIPSIVIEFVLGVIVGPDVLGWLKIDEPLDVLGLLALGWEPDRIGGAGRHRHLAVGGAAGGGECVDTPGR